MENKRLPHIVKEALIQVCGRSFWLKQPLIDLFIDSGIPESVIREHEELSKFKIARAILSDLEKQGEEGYLIQKRLLTNLCNLRKPTDESVTDRDGAISALRHLKEVALKENLVRKEEQKKQQGSRLDAEDKAAQIQQRNLRLEDLKKKFSEQLREDNLQARGYSLEDILKELFEINEIEYRSSYKTDTVQVDGRFRFESFDYLVEARWRKEMPSTSEIGGFAVKVQKVIKSTRGLFLSIQGFRPEVVADYSGRGCELILMDGRDLALILEGYVSLRDALKLKIDKAVEEGISFHPLY